MYTLYKHSFGKKEKSVSHLLLSSLLAGTDDPAEGSAGGLSARGEEGLSSSDASVANTSILSSG